MEIVDDSLIEFYQDLLKERALTEESHWLKKDYLTLEEAILIYYKIEPFSNHLQFKNEQIASQIDVLSIKEVFLDTKFNRGQGVIEPSYFTRFLHEKKFEIPTWLIKFLPPELQNSKNPSEENAFQSYKSAKEFIESKLSTLTIPQLKLLFIRCYAAYFWKTAKGSDAKISASELTHRKDFTTVISFVDEEVKDHAKFAEKFSDLSPRSPTRKKDS